MKPVKTLFAISATFSRYVRGLADHLLFAAPPVLLVFANVTTSAIGIAVAVSLSFPRMEVDSIQEDIIIPFVTFVILVSTLNTIILVVYRFRFMLNIDDSDVETYNNKFIDAYRGKDFIKVSKFGRQALVYDIRTCHHLNALSNKCVVERNRYSLPEPLNDIRISLLLKVPRRTLDTFNQRKIRLRTDVDHESFQGNREICLQETAYYYDRITNNIAGYHVKYGFLKYISIGEWNVDTNGRLERLSASVYSNQLGGGCILITADRRIVYVRQGLSTTENKGRLAPAGSGSFDWSDVHKLRQNGKDVIFQDLGRRATFRELREEVGIKAKFEDCESIIVGIGRSLYRGGKPEVFSIVLTGEKSDCLDVRPQEWDYIDREILFFTPPIFSDGPGLVVALKMFLNFLGDSCADVSGPLGFNIELAIEAIAYSEYNSKRVSSFFQGIDNKRKL